MFCQDSWSDLIHLANKLEHWIIWQMTESKLALGDVAGVGLAEDGVAVAGNDLSRLESGPEVVRNSFVTKVATDLLLHFLQPIEDLLVGTTEGISFRSQSRGNRERTGRATGLLGR